VGVDEVLRLLGEQEAMCRAEVARLEVEQERITGLLAACRVELDRLVVAREVVAGLTAPPPAAVVASAGSGAPAVQSTEFGAATAQRAGSACRPDAVPGGGGGLG
jgi:hypothetical protein